MGKTALGIWNKIRKDEHRASPLGQIERKLNEFYDARPNRMYFETDSGEPNEHARWIDRHRIETRSEQNTLEINFDNEYEALVKKYKELTDQLLLTKMTEEYDYLTKLQNGN